MTDDRKPLPAKAEMVLVPREPTEVQEAAFWAAQEEYKIWKRDRIFPRPTLMHHLWIAMLTAAPKATETPGLRETAIHDHAWWLAVANLAGKHGVRYETNRRLEAFLDGVLALSATPQPVAVPDDGAGGDEVEAICERLMHRVGMFHGGATGEARYYHRPAADDDAAAAQMLRALASALSAERAARTSAEALAETHREARERHREERDAERAAHAEALIRARQNERNLVADQLEDEADVLPCAEDAKATSGNAALVRAGFSYEDVEAREDRLDKAERERDAERAAHEQTRRKLTEATEQAERQWSGWVRESVSRKAAEADAAHLSKALHEIAELGFLPINKVADETIDQTAAKLLYSRLQACMNIALAVRSSREEGK